MPEHTVKQGECLSSLAKRYGFSDWRTIYDHGKNVDFRKKRPNPNLIYPGDTIFIPEREVHQEPRATGAVHRFKLKRARTMLRLRVLGDDDESLVVEKYRLTIDADGTHTERERELPEGALIEEPIPPHASRGKLKIWLRDTETDEESVVEWTLALGHLDPVDTISGIQARLRNLGYATGPIDGELGPVTKRAVRSFQEAHDLEVDGDPGPNTQAKLEEVHGC